MTGTATSLRILLRRGGVRRLAVGAAWTAAACLGGAFAPAASPELHAIAPAGVQRGTDATLLFSGQRLADAQAVLFYRPGVTVRGLKAESGETVRVDCTIAPDCPLGEHAVRLYTSTGLSELRTFWVADLPTVAEVEPNNEFAAPQRVPLNSTIAGVVQREDVDHYSVELRAGQRLSVEIEALRLGRAMFDPFVAILDARRFELAVNDDSSLLLQDSVASILAPADGLYTIQVREASYGGDDNCHYRLHVGDYPRPLVAFPPGGLVGQTQALALLGDPAGPIVQQVRFVDAAGAHFQSVEPASDGRMAPSPVWVRPSTVACRTEPIASLAAIVSAPSQPEASSQPAAPSSAPAPGDAPAPPIAFHGILEVTGEMDTFEFTAVKGVAYDVSVIARRLRSPLDSLVEIFDPAGNGVAGNDDSGGPDSYLRFTAPEDGVYRLRVRDQRGRGGPLFVYRAGLGPVQPGLALTLERLDSRRPQYLQTVVVPQGNRHAALVRADRRDVGGAVALSADGLPAGVQMHCEAIADGLAHVPVVFEAAADAPLGAGLVGLHGSIALPDGSRVKGDFQQVFPLVVGPPNETVYYETRVDRLALAVTQPAPFSIELTPPPAPIVRGGTMQLQVTAQRREGFSAPIEVHMLWNPPGVSSAGGITIPAQQTEAYYPLDAAGDAPTRSVKIAVLAKAEIDGGHVWTSSQLVDLTIAEPFVGGSIAMAATQPGQPASVVVALQQLHPFDGPATVRLLGLPPNTRAPELQVTAADQQAVFAVAVPADAPQGAHNTLFCELVLAVNGAPVVHRFGGGGVLRIDAPAVAAAVQPAAPPPPAAAEAAPPQPLSRLEQLRQKAAQEATAGGAGDAP